MKVFKIDITNIFIKFIASSIVLTILILIFSEVYSLLTYVSIIILVVAIEFLIFFLTTTLFKIEIMQNAIQLYFIKVLIFKKVQIIDFTDFQFYYKDEIGARGVKSEELRFYKNNQKIVGVGRGFDGWTEKNLVQIIKEFERLKIKRII